MKTIPFDDQDDLDDQEIDCPDNDGIEFLNVSLSLVMSCVIGTLVAEYLGKLLKESDNGSERIYDCKH